MIPNLAKRHHPSQAAHTRSSGVQAGVTGSRLQSSPSSSAGSWRQSEMSRLSELEGLLGHLLTDDQLQIAQRLLDLGVTPRGVAETLRTTETPVKQAQDHELRTVRYEALGDGSARRIPEDTQPEG
jgi:hypothetical protein